MEGAGLTATFFASLAAAFVFTGVAVGVARFATRVFLGAGFGVALGDGVVLASILGFGVGVEAFVGRGVGVTVGIGNGVGLGCSISLLAGNATACSSGGACLASSSGTVGGGVDGTASREAGGEGMALELTTAAAASIQRISVAAGFFALPLQRASPKSTTACTAPMIATLRQKLQFRGIG